MTAGVVSVTSDCFRVQTLVHFALTRGKIDGATLRNVTIFTSNSVGVAYLCVATGSLVWTKRYNNDKRHFLAHMGSDT